jgi:hypothetical protein
MRITATVLTFFLGMVSFVTSPNETGWRGIRPLHATRSDVEKLIGPPMESDGITYDLNDERVNITYSKFPCAKGWPYGWNVPADTVISIVTYPKRKLVLSDLQIDLNKFTLSDRRENQRVIYYSEEEGITVQTENNQQVVSIEYHPVSSDSYLRCPEAAAREASLKKGETASLRPVLYYHEISQQEQRVRLDYFAEKVKEHPGSTIYIIGYRDSGECADETRKRTDWAKEYLVRKRSIPTELIKIIDGGLRDDVWVELFIVEPGGPIPLPSPNIYPKSERSGTNCAGSH